MLQSPSSAEQPAELFAGEIQHFLSVLGNCGVPKFSESTRPHHGKKTQTHLPLGLGKRFTNPTARLVQTNSR